jgi:Zn-dependent peptidase ImmA (M78 family)/DNA-binding XRE family transcriptional regulator
MNTSPLAHNLRRLRDEKGLSQAEVAERAGISRVAYRNIETGEAAPRTGTLARLAVTLGVKTADLMAEVRTLQAVRFRQRKMTSREQLLVRVSRWLESYAELEEVLGDKPKFTFGKALGKVGSDGSHRAERMAAAAREVVGLKPEEPIGDICRLLEENGVKVFPHALASEAFFGLSVGKEDGGPAVVVNVWSRITVERWIFTAAHELGHLLLHLDAYKVAEQEEDKEQEKEADIFGSHFLMPAPAFEREWQAARGLPFVDRVMQVKAAFRVSYRTVLHRVQDTTSLGASVWERFQAQYKERYGRILEITEEPQGLKQAEPAIVETHSGHEPDRLYQSEFTGARQSRLVREAIEKNLISLGRGAEILGKDLSEMRKLVASWVE